MIRRFFGSTVKNEASGTDVDYTQTGNIIDDGGGYYVNNPIYAPDKVFDDDPSTFYNTADVNMCNAFVGRDLLSVYDVNYFYFLPRQHPDWALRMNTSQIQYSNDGMNYTTIQTISGVTSGNFATPLEYNLTTVSARYFRLFFPNCTSNGNVAEMQIWFKA